MRHETLGEWLAWLEDLHPKAIDLGLDRVGAVAARMGLNRPGCPVITVAGTNGKGSCVALLEAVLTAAGHRVAAYTSPHLLHYNERVRVDGREAGDAELCAAFDRVDRARDDISLTYFEFGTLAALDLFAASAPDIMILEVGLGGRLDAVNIVDCDVALVTAIGLDHVEWLGRDRDTIAREKAGIFRTGRPAVCADPAAPISLLQTADELGVPLFLAGRDFSVEFDPQDPDRWSWRSGDTRIAGLPAPGLQGRFQYDNAAAVLMLLSLLPQQFQCAEAVIRDVLPRIRVPGRFQRLSGTATVILDVAHNVDAVRALAISLLAEPASGRTRAVTAMLGDKDIDGMISSMSDIVDEWHVAGLQSARAATVQRLRDAIMARAPASPVIMHADVASAYREALGAAQSGDRIVVFGSFHTVGEVMQLEVQRMALS